MKVYINGNNIFILDDFLFDTCFIIFLKSVNINFIYTDKNISLYVHIIPSLKEKVHNE